MKKRKAVCLISDGLDSPVATYLLERKGIEVVGINFDNKPLVVPVKKIQAKGSNIIIIGQITNIASCLVSAFSHQKSFDLYIVPNGMDLKKIVELTDDPQIICLLCKRLMLRKAEQMAIELDADFIATGEILGEQASQTIDNLRNIESVLTTKQLLRPLVGINKEEVIEISRKIGTYQHSEKSAKYTCGAVPNKPATHTKIDRILEAERKLNIQEITENCIEKSQKVTLNKSQ
ncbi:MAG: hypothetical protein ACTSQB_04735 [Candidatus Heimdallarchaeota archaeon]